jgi:hypothetical protein
MAPIVLSGEQCVKATSNEGTWGPDSVAVRGATVVVSRVQPSPDAFASGGSKGYRYRWLLTLENLRPLTDPLASKLLDDIQRAESPRAANVGKIQMFSPEIERHRAESLPFHTLTHVRRNAKVTCARPPLNRSAKSL